MIRLAAAMAIAPLIASAQDAAARGAEIYNKTCATGYCHGVKGAQSGAPRLASRGFDEAYITQVVRNGISGSAMPSFGSVLPFPELQAVIAYVAGLNGVTPAPVQPPPRGPAPRNLSPEAARGRSLFFAATLGFSRCSTCHQLDGLGIAVTEPITHLPDSGPALRELAKPHVSTVMTAGESFPALVVSKGGSQTKVYDLTTPPPVLRTFPAVDVNIKEGSSWSHAAALAAYSDDDLKAILVYLQAVVHP
jgi:mono/diheme cytochrome c family protein